MSKIWLSGKYVCSRKSISMWSVMFLTLYLQLSFKVTARPLTINNLWVTYQLHLTKHTQDMTWTSILFINLLWTQPNIFRNIVHNHCTPITLKQSVGEVWASLNQGETEYASGQLIINKHIIYGQHAEQFPKSRKKKKNTGNKEKLYTMQKKNLLIVDWDMCIEEYISFLNLYTELFFSRKFK